MNYEQQIQQISDYIQFHLDEKLDIEAIYQLSGFSKFHFHRIFSAYTGVSVTRFIVLCRFKRASYQLAFHLQMNILEIAIDAGFESHEAFTRAFKKLTGQTPSEFRSAPHWQNWHHKLHYNLPRRNTMMNVDIIQRKSEKIAYLTHQGHPQKVLETANHFMIWRKETGLSPIKSSHTYGIPYSDPLEDPENFRFDIAGSITQDLPNFTHKIAQGEIPAGRYAKLTHIGSHNELNECIYYLYRQWLNEYQEEAADFPVFFQYHNFIHEVPEHELMTDILLLLK